MEHNYLPLFITEEIYLIKGDEVTTSQATSAYTANTPNQEPAQVVSKVEEPAPTPKLPTPEKEPEVIHELAIWCPPLTKEDRELLSKILMAIKKDLNKAHLMEGIGSYAPHYKTLLCFGYQKELELKIGESVAPYSPTEKSGNKILVSASPSDLHGDPAQKKRLWEALQKMFL